MKIAVDVMGTDYGPKELVLGAVNAVKVLKHMLLQVIR